MANSQSRGGCIGILLAAGRGTRFDPSGSRNKLLAECGNGVVVSEAARRLLAALPEVVAVVRSGDLETAQILEHAGCRVVFAATAGQGMSASLRCGLTHASDAAGWVIALGDMPHVQVGTITALAGAIEAGAHIAAPFHNGRRGNPVAFGRLHHEALMRLSGDQGARALIASGSVTEVPVDDPGIFLDIDTVADLGTSSSNTSP